MKGIFQMYKVREPRRLTIERETLLPKEQPLESDAENKAQTFPSAQDAVAEKLRKFHEKRPAKKVLSFAGLKSDMPRNKPLMNPHKFRKERQCSTCVIR